MASELRRFGTYRLLYYQPSPETGERLTVGLLFEESGRAFLYYDERFKKLTKLFPWIDGDTMALVLDDLRSSLSGTRNVSEVLNLYAPQLIASEPRQVVLPVTDLIVKMMMDKFVHSSPRVAQEPKRDPVAVAIQAFVKNRIHGDIQFHTEVGPETILGRRTRGLGTVAMAAEGPNGWTLIDGVDLNVLTPKAAMGRADAVGQTFWNYTRAAQGKQIRKVGIVLNGNSHTRPTTHDAHDYALHRFQTDADAAIDNGSLGATAKLEAELQSLGDKP